ncbi:MAG: hypothetical protein N2645_07895 [Clostridia bacterium]|nr:hypothetical protein [Clostridia bacterium]
MDVTKPKQIKNELEKEIEDLREWQENQYNPGYYIGTGRVARPISSLSKYPWLLILFGILALVPLLFQLIYLKLDIESLAANIIPIILTAAIAGALIYGGIVRLIRNKVK